MSTPPPANRGTTASQIVWMEQYISELEDKIADYNKTTASATIIDPYTDAVKDVIMLMKLNVCRCRCEENDIKWKMIKKIEEEFGITENVQSYSKRRIEALGIRKVSFTSTKPVGEF